MTEQISKNSQQQHPEQLSAAALAYLGDAVMELLVRKHLVSAGISHAGELNAKALSYVRATAQSGSIETLLPLLTEEEQAVYRRGRNGAGAHPKSATVAEYRRATGLEALFGYLYLCGREERLNTLFSQYAAYVEKEACENGSTKGS